VTPTKSTTFEYDIAGRLTGYDDGTTAAHYTLDEKGRTITATVTYPGFVRSYSYTYAPDGAKASFTGPDGLTYDYHYDEQNNLTNITMPGLGAYEQEFEQGRLVTTTMPGATIDRAYDSQARLSGITAQTTAAGTIMAYTYTRDPAGQILVKATEHGPYAYGYDDVYRLTAADNPTLPDESFTYDHVGNRLTADAGAEAYTYNANNEMLGAGQAAYE
jgi:YD repeat-containing protein